MVKNLARSNWPDTIGTAGLSVGIVRPPKVAVVLTALKGNLI